MRLSFPATVSRLMSAIATSLLLGPALRAPALVRHALCRMKPCITAITFVAGPVWRHPRRPAELTEPAKPDRLGGARGDRQFGVVFELLAIVEEHQVGKR